MLESQLMKYICDKSRGAILQNPVLTAMKTYIKEFHTTMEIVKMSAVPSFNSTLYQAREIRLVEANWSTNRELGYILKRNANKF